MLKLALKVDQKTREMPAGSKTGFLNVFNWCLKCKEITLKRLQKEVRV